MACCFITDYDDREPIYVSGMGIEQDGAQAHWGPGRREWYILHYVLRGRGIFNGQPVAAGNGFLIRPGQLHEYHADPAQPWQYFWLIFGGSAAESYVRHAGCAAAQFPVPFTAALLRLAERLRLRAGAIPHYEALAVFFEIWAMHTAGTRPTGERALIRQAKMHIESSLSAPPTVCGIADALHISDRYLYNLFVREVGVPPKQYIIRQRIDAACDLLRTTDAPVSAVASAVGFGEVSPFSRFFARYVGMSPTAYRHRSAESRPDFAPCPACSSAQNDGS